MTPAARKKLMRLWKAFSAAIEVQYEKQDDAVDIASTNEVINDAADLARLIRTRGRYLNALVDAGLLNGDESPPSDDRLWEIYPGGKDIENYRLDVYD